MTDVPHRILDLIETFDRNIEAYRSPQYNETQLRLEFIDPFFEELGWDVSNKAGNAPQYRDVIHEDAISVSGATKAPDYCFRIGGVRKFFLEAKKPSVNIKDAPHPAYQLRRYAWSVKLPLSILTDFEEFAVYDCQARPKHTDSAATARIMFFNYKQYPEKWHEIADIFGKDAIWKGSFDKFAVSEKGKRGTTTVDTEFLAEIESWRRILAQIIALRNRLLSTREVNFAVQQTIDRILFLRMCEDRGIESLGQLQTLTAGDRVYPRLCEIFEKADQRYNSGLFHFEDEPNREPPDKLTLNLIIDDDKVKWILRSLYYPQCPYVFSVLPPEILGNVYEQFLGKIISVSSTRRVKIDEKPEVKKAGGVYYTPSYIVDYIVKNTVGKLTGDPTAGHCESAEGGRGNLTNDPSAGHCEETEGRRGNLINDPSCHSERSEESRSSIVNRNSKIGNQKPLTPKQIANLKILDPACGSGSFLLGAYTYLLNYHRDWYVANDPQKYTKQIYQGRAGDWFLTITEKKRILLNNIFGVDIDLQAVEVTKLSLLLKVLEGENSQTLENQYRLFHERALPDLANNIKCGNSLIAPDFFDNLDSSVIASEAKQSHRRHSKRSEESKKYLAPSFTGGSLDDLRQKINAFDWQQEFPQIFSRKNLGAKRRSAVGGPKTDGFDTIIGNPPYRKERDSKELIADLKQSSYGKKYYAGKMDFWYFFLHRAIDLTKPNGFISFIVPSYWLKSTGSSKLVGHVKHECSFVDVVDFGKNKVFENVGGQHMTFVLVKSTSHPHLTYQRYTSKRLTQSEISRSLFEKSQAHSCLLSLDNRKIYTPDNKIDFQRSLHTSLLEKLASYSFLLEGPEKIFLVSQGIVEAPNIVSPAMAKKANKPALAGRGVFVLSPEEFAAYAFNENEKKFLKPYLCAAYVSRYYYCLAGYYVFYIGNTENRHITNNRKLYPNITHHLRQYREFITSSNAPYGIHRTREARYFTSEKLLCPNMFDKPCFTYSPEECYVNFAFNVVIPNKSLYSLKYLLGILNSTLGAFWFNLSGKKRGINVDVGVGVMRRFPVRIIDFSVADEKVKHDKMVKFVERMLELHKGLAAAKIPDEKTRIQREITATDNQIDHLVYNLYGLTKEEIKIVEESTK